MRVRVRDLESKGWERGERKGGGSVYLQKREFRGWERGERE